MKKLIFLLAISFIFFSCKKEDTVTPIPDVIITTGTLDINYTGQQINGGPQTNSFLTKVELQDSTTYYAYDSTSWVKTNPSQWNFTATIKNIQPGKYKCKLTHWQTDSYGVWRDFYYTINDSITIIVNETTTVRSIY
jgi:hypothetical protein